MEESYEKVFESIQAEVFCASHVDRHIEYCEKQYGMTTKEFVLWFKEKNFEGNVDMKLWFKFASIK